MNRKYKLITLLTTIVLILSVVFVLFACGKKSNDPFGNLSNGVADSKPADAPKDTKSTNASPYSAFQDLMNAVNNTSGDVVRQFNDILRSEIETTIKDKRRVTDKETGKVTEETTEYIIRTRVYLIFKDTGVDKNEILFEILKKVPGQEDLVQTGLYYKEGILIFKSLDANPLWIKDIDLNKIFTFASRHGVNTFLKNIVNSIITNSLNVTVGGNTIPIMELIGPIVFPIIFSTDVNILTKQNSGDIPENVKRYVLTFNAQKFVQAMTPVLARIPSLVESLVPNGTENLTSLVNTLLGKFELQNGGTLSIEGLKNYNFNLFKRKVIYDIDTKTNKLLNIKLNSETPEIKTNQDQDEVVNVRELTTLEGNSVTDEASAGPKGNFLFPSDVNAAIENAKGAQPSIEQFNFGKADINLEFVLESDRERAISLNDLLLNGQDATEIVKTIKKTQIKFKQKLEIEETLFDSKDINQLVERKYQALKDQLTDRKEDLLRKLDIASGDDKITFQNQLDDVLTELKTINSMYSDFKTSELMALVITELGDRKFKIQAGHHGFRLSIKTDIDFRKLHESRVAIELSEANQKPLIGVYLVPYDEVNQLSALVIDMENIGFPRIKVDGINLNKIVYEPLVEKVNQIFSEMSSKGFINFIMGVVDSIKSKSAKPSAITSENSQLEQVRLTYDNKKLTYLAEQLPTQEKDQNIIRIIESIVSDSGFVGEDKRTVQVVISNDNIKALSSFISGSLAKKSELQKEVGNIIGNLLSNLLYNVTVEVGSTTEDTKPSKSYSDYKGFFKIKLAFLNDDKGANQTISNTNTKMEIGLDKSSLFFKLPQSFYDKTTDIKNKLPQTPSIYDTKNVTLKGDIKLALESSSDEEKDVIEFLKNLSPEFEDKINQLQEEYSRDFGFTNNELQYGISADIRKGLTFAIKIEFEADINISPLKAFDINADSMKSVNSITALKLLFSKYKLEDMLRSAYIKANIYTALNIDDIKDKDGKWKPNGSWNEFAKIVYSSEEPMEGTSKKGGLFVDFISTQLPSISLPLDLKSLIMEKAKNTFVVPDDQINITPSQQEENQQGGNTSKPKPNLDVKNLLFGVVGGIDLFAQQIVVNLANTTISTLINQIFPNNTLLNDPQTSGQAIPTARIGALLKYSKDGISLEVFINKLKLNGNLTEDDEQGNGGINVSFAFGNLSIKSSNTEKVINITNKSNYLSITDIKSKIESIKLGLINKDVYVGVNTELDLSLSSNVKEYAQNFEQLLSFMNERIDEIIQKGDLSESDKNTLQQLKQLQLSLNVLNSEGKELYTGVKIKIAGRVDIAKLLDSIKKLQKQGATKDEVISAAKSLIGSLDLAISVALYNTESSENPDRLLAIYIDGEKEDIYIRVLSSSVPSINASNDTKIKISLNEGWNLVAGLFLVKDPSNSALINTNSISTLESSNLIKKVYEVLFENIKGRIEGKLDDLKSVLTKKSTIFGLLSKVVISKEGLGIETSDTVLKAVLKKLGLTNTQGLPIIRVGGQVKLLDEVGNLGGLEAIIRIANKEADDKLKDILAIKVGVPKINVGILLSDDNQLKQKLSAKTLLGNEFFSNIVFGSDLSTYTNIKDVKDFKLSTTIVIGATASSKESLKQFLVNFGLNENIESVTDISPNQAFKISLRIAIPLSDIYKTLVDTYNQDEYSYEVLSTNPEKNKEVKKYITNEVIRYMFTNSKILAKIDVIDKEDRTEKANVLTLYYEGQNVGNNILFNSKILGLENPIKIEGAPQKIAPVLLNLIIKGKTPNKHQGNSGYLQSDLQLNVINLIQQMLDSKNIDKLDLPFVASVLLEPDILKIELGSGIIAIMLDLAGVKLSDLELQRLVSKVALTARNNTTSHTFEFGAKLNIGGLNKKSEGNYEVVDTFELSVSLTELFLSAESDNKLSIFTSNDDVQIININSNDPQYISLGLDVLLEPMGSLTDFYLTPSVHLLKKLLLNIPGVQDKVKADDINKIFDGLDKILKLTEQDINLQHNKYTAKLTVKLNVKDFLDYLKQTTDNELALSNKYSGNYNNIPKKELEIARLKANLNLSYLYFKLELVKNSDSIFAVGYDSKNINNENKPIVLLRSMSIANNQTIFLPINELDIPKIVTRSIKKSNLTKIAALNNQVEEEEIVIDKPNSTKSLSNESLLEVITAAFDNIANLSVASRLDKEGNKPFNVSLISGYVNLIDLLSRLSTVFAQLEYVEQIQDYLEEYYSESKLGEDGDIIPNVKVGIQLNFLPIELKLNVGIQQKVINNKLPEAGLNLGIKGLNIKVDTLDETVFKNVNDVFFELNTELSLDMKSDNLEKLMKLGVKDEKVKNYLDGTLIKVILQDLNAGKTIDVKLQSYINLGDIFQDSVTEYRSRIALSVKLSALNNKEIIIRTDLKNFYIDLSALNLPKVKIAVELVPLIKNAIRTQIVKKEEEIKKQEKDLENNIITPPSSTPAPEQTGSKVNAISMIATVLSSINKSTVLVEKNGDHDSFVGYKIEFKANFIDALLESLLNVTLTEENSLNTTLFDELSLEIKDFEMKGPRLQIGTLQLELKEKISDDSSFVIGTSIGKEVKTLLGLVYSSSDSVDEEYTNFSNQFMNAVADHKKLDDLAITIRTNAFIELKSKGEPFLSLSELVKFMFKKMNKNFNTEGFSDALLNKLNEQMPGDVTVENHTGIYSYTQSNNTFRYNIYLNVDLPIYELFTNVEESQFRVQLKIVDSKEATLINVIYSQQKQSLIIDSPMAGISGVEIIGIDIFGMIKSIPNISNVFDILIADLDAQTNTVNLSERNTAKLLTALSESTRDNSNLEIKYTNDVLVLTIRSSFIEKLKGVIINKQTSIVNNVSTSDADKEKAQNIISLLNAIPDIRDIKLEVINNKENTTNNKAAVTLSISQTLNENTDSEMVLSLGIDLTNHVFKSYDKASFATRENPIQDEITSSSRISIKDIEKIKEGANLLEFFPIKKLDAQFGGLINIRIDEQTYQEGPIGQIFKLIDKLLLGKDAANSKSGFEMAQNSNKVYDLKLEGRAILNFNSVDEFKANTGINLKITLNNEVLANISYIAQENVLYLDLTKLGLMKVKIYGVNLLSLIGPTLFPSNELFNVPVSNLDASSNTDKSVLALNYRDIVALNDDTIVGNAARVEIGFNIQEATKSYEVSGQQEERQGILGNMSIKINDIFIKHLFKILIKNQIRELMVNNSQSFIDSGNFATDIQNEIENKNKLLETLEGFSFNDILVKLSLFSNPAKGYTGLYDLSININLDKKDGSGRIHKNNIYENPNDIFNNHTENNYLKISIDNIRLNEYQDGVSINSISTEVGDKESYSGLVIGDLASLINGANKAQFIPLISNVVETLTQDGTTSGSTNILKGQINVRSASTTNKLSIQVLRSLATVKEEKNPLSVIVDGKTDANKTFQLIADLALAHTYITLSDAPDTDNILLNSIKPILKSIVNQLDIKGVLGNALLGLKNVNESQENQGTSNSSSSDGKWIETVFSVQNGNNSKFWTDWTTLKSAYNWHASKIVSEEQLVKLERIDGQITNNNTIWLNIYDKNLNYLGDSGYLPRKASYTGQEIFNIARSKYSNAYYVSIRIYNDNQKDKIKTTLRKRNYTFKNVLEPADGKITNLIESIKINTAPKVTPIYDSDYLEYTPTTSSSLIKVNFEKDKMAQVIANLMSFLSNTFGDVAESVHNYYTDYQSKNDSQYVQSTVDMLNASLVKLLAPMDKRLYAFGLSAVKTYILSMTTSLWPLPYPGWIKNNGNAYLEVLLEGEKNKLFSKIHLKLSDSANNKGWELLLDNNGIRLPNIESATNIELETQRNSKIIKYNTALEDVYNPNSYQKAYGYLLSGESENSAYESPNLLSYKSNATFKISYNGSTNTYTKPISVSWLRGDTILDPTKSTEEMASNVIELFPYAMNKKINYSHDNNEKVKITVSRESVRKPYKFFVGTTATTGSGLEWKELDYSIFENIKPGQAIEIRNYLNSIRELAVQMKDGNGNIVDTKAPFTISVNGADIKVYKFGYTDSKGKKFGEFRFDTSNLPETIEEIKNIESENKFIKLSYSLGLTKSVTYSIPFTVENIAINEADLIAQVQELLKDLTKDPENSQITNDPSRWSYTTFGKLMEKQFNIKLSPDKYNSDPSKVYKFVGKIVLPPSFTVQDLNMDYTGTKPNVLGVKQDESGVDIPGKTAQVATFYPQYKPQRLTFSNTLVYITMILPDNTKVSLGTLNLASLLTLDVYPPYSLSTNYKKSTITAVSAPVFKSQVFTAQAKTYKALEEGPAPLPETSIKVIKVDLKINNEKLETILGQEIDNLTFVDYDHFVSKLAGENNSKILSFIDTFAGVNISSLGSETLKKTTISAKLTEFGYTGTLEQFLTELVKNINFYQMSEDAGNVNSVIMKVVQKDESNNKIQIIRFVERNDSKVYFTFDNFILTDTIKVTCMSTESSDNKANTIKKAEITLNYSDEEATKTMLQTDSIDTLFYKDFNDTKIKETLINSIKIKGKAKAEFSNVITPIGYVNNSYQLFNLENNIEPTDLKTFSTNNIFALDPNEKTVRFNRFAEVNKTHRYLIKFTFKLYDVEFEVLINRAKFEGLENETDETTVIEKINDSIVYTNIGTTNVIPTAKLKYLPKVKIEQYGKIRLDKAVLEFNESNEDIVLNKSLFSTEKDIGYFYGPYNDTGLNILSESYLNNSIRYIKVNNFKVDILVLYLTKIGNLTFTDSESIISLNKFNTNFETAKAAYNSKLKKINEILSLTLNSNQNQLDNILLSVLIAENKDIFENTKKTVSGVDTYEFNSSDIHFIKSGKNTIKLKSSIQSNTNSLLDKDLVDISKIDQKIKAIANIGKLDVSLKLIANSSITGEDLVSEYETNDLGFKVVLSNSAIKEFDFVFDFFTGIDVEKDVLNNYKVKEYTLNNYSVKRHNSDIDLKDNFNIQVENFNIEELSDSNKNQIIFKIGPKKVKVVFYDREFSISYLSKQPKAFNYRLEGTEFLNLDVKLKYKNLDNPATYDLSDLIPGLYKVDLEYKLVLKESVKSLVDENNFNINEHYILDTYIYKNNREVKMEESDRKDLDLRVTKIKITINYKNLESEFSGETLELSDLIDVYHNEEILTDKFIREEFLNKDPHNKTNPTKINFKLKINSISQDVLYQTDPHGKRYIDIFRLPNLGAGKHTFSIELDNKKSDIFELIDNDGKFSIITINKKPIEFRIGKALKYYNQEIDTDTIPLLEKDVENVVDIDCMEELSIPEFIGYDPEDKETPIKFKEKPPVYSKLFKGFVTWEEYSLNEVTNEVEVIKKSNTISDLAIQFNWVEGVGLQEIKVSSYDSPNYYIDINKVNAKPGIMDIKKTKIKLYFSDKIKKYYGSEDPIISLSGMVYQHPALDIADDNQYLYLIYNGIYEVTVSETEFVGSLNRIKGNKVGEYQFDNSNLKLANPNNYELEFVNNKGEAIKSLKEDKNAVLLIEPKPKTIPKEVAKPLIIFFIVIEVAMIIAAIVLLRIAKKYKKERKLNNWKEKYDK